MQDDRIEPNERSWGLTHRYIGERWFIELSQDRYDAVLESMEGIQSALEIEEKFELHLANYEELEAELLRLALKETMRRDYDWSKFRDSTVLISRRVFNFLSSGKMYQEQLRKDAVRIKVNGRSLRSRVNDLIKKASKQHLGYRFAVALRNYSQHHSLPIASASRSIRWIRDSDGNAVHAVHHADPRIDLAKLRSEARFPEAIAEELSELGNQIDVSHLFRDSIEAVMSIQEAIRDSLNDPLKEWVPIVEGTVHEVVEQHGEEARVGIIAVARGSGEHIVEQRQVATNSIKRLEELRQRNRGYEKFQMRSVASARTDRDWSGNPLPAPKQR